MEFVNRVEVTIKTDLAVEEDIGEAPEEFLGGLEGGRERNAAKYHSHLQPTDPIMFSVMEDPVILPGSRATVDRTTIRSHLLSDAHDPFNRQPLKLEDVIPSGLMAR